MRKNIHKTKNKISQYTAFVPNTLRATRGVGSTLFKKFNSFLNKTAKTVKKRAKILDSKIAKSIRSLTKKHRY